MLSPLAMRVESAPPPIAPGVATLRVHPVVVPIVRLRHIASRRGLLHAIIADVKDNRPIANVSANTSILVLDENRVCVAP